MGDESNKPEPHAHDAAAMGELARLWVQSQTVVSAYLRANVIDAHHAEDLVQDVAQICAEKFSTYNRQRPFVAWALGIARNRLLKYYRTKSRDRLVLSEPALVQLESALEQLQPEIEDRREALQRCLQRLRGRRRAVLNMRYRENARVVDIAEQLDMSPSGVSEMLHRVRSFLFGCVRRQLSSGGS